VARSRGGDAAAFERIVDVHSAAVYRICEGMLGASEAEDAAQEAFVRVHAGLASFRGDSKLSTWIHRVTTNVALKRAAKRRRRPAAAGLDAAAEVAATGPSPEAGVDAEERRAALRRALDQLPPEQRAVVVLRGLEGLPFDVVARTLGIPEPTAQSRMSRAKARLRELLGRLLPDEPGSNHEMGRSS
jgi:RNA polymerase sigma-70 factor (ECF subfamily)